MKTKNLLSIIILTVLCLFSANQAFAICEGPLVPCGRGGDPCRFCHIFELINNIIAFVLTCLAPIIAVLMLIIGGIFMLIAGGSPQLFNRAKSIITAVVIGLAIIFVAWVFLNTLFVHLEVAEWTGLGTWWEIKCQ